MPQRFYVTPKPGIKIRRPDTGQHLDPAGARQTDRVYWTRREKEGAVTIAAKAPSKKPATKETKS